MSDASLAARARRRRPRRRRSRSFTRAGCPRRRTSPTSAPTAGCRAAFARRASCCGHQAERQPGRGRARVRRRGAGQRGALHGQRHAGGAGAGQPGALPSGRAARGAGELRLRERGDRRARPGRRRQDAGRGGDGAGRRPGGGRAGVDRRDQPSPAGRADAQGHPRGLHAARARRRRRLSAGDPDDRPDREARDARGGAAVGNRAPDRAVQGRGDDLAELRDDAVLRADRRRAGAARRPSCC